MVFSVMCIEIFRIFFFLKRFGVVKCPNNKRTPLWNRAPVTFFWTSLGCNKRAARCWRYGAWRNSRAVLKDDKFGCPTVSARLILRCCWWWPRPPQCQATMTIVKFLFVSNTWPFLQKKKTPNDFIPKILIYVISFLLNRWHIYLYIRGNKMVGNLNFK